MVAGSGDGRAVAVKARVAGQDVQEGGLAGAVDADETDAVQRVDDETDVPKNRLVADGLGEVFDDKV